jgi:hypothetical protein
MKNVPQAIIITQLIILAALAMNIVKNAMDQSIVSVSLARTI